MSFTWAKIEASIILAIIVVFGPCRFHWFQVMIVVEVRTFAFPLSLLRRLRPCPIGQQSPQESTVWSLQLLWAVSHTHITHTQIYVYIIIYYIYVYIIIYIIIYIIYMFWSVLIYPPLSTNIDVEKKHRVDHFPRDGLPGLPLRGPGCGKWWNPVDLHRASESIWWNPSNCKGIRWRRLPISSRHAVFIYIYLSLSV